MLGVISLFQLDHSAEKSRRTDNIRKAYKRSAGFIKSPAAGEQRVKILKMLSKQKTIGCIRSKRKLKSGAYKLPVGKH